MKNQLNRYLVRFHGRKVLAIGVCYWIEDTCAGHDIDHAVVHDLYKRWEHISSLTVLGVEPLTEGQV